MGLLPHMYEMGCAGVQSEGGVVVEDDFHPLRSTARYKEVNPPDRRHWKPTYVVTLSQTPLLVVRSGYA